MKSNQSNIFLSLVAVVVTLGFLYLAIQLLRDPDDKNRPMFSNGVWNSDFEYSATRNTGSTAKSSTNSALPNHASKSVKSINHSSEKASFLLNSSSNSSAVAQLDLNGEEQFFTQYMNLGDGPTNTYQRTNRKRQSVSDFSQNIAMSDYKLNLLDISKKRVEKASGSSMLNNSDVLGNHDGMVKVAPPTEADPGEVPLGNGYLFFGFLLIIYSGIKVRKYYLAYAK